VLSKSPSLPVILSPPHASPSSSLSLSCSGCPHRWSSSPVLSSSLPLSSVSSLSVLVSFCPVDFVIVVPLLFCHCTLPVFTMPIAHFHLGYNTGYTAGNFMHTASVICYTVPMKTPYSRVWLKPVAFIQASQWADTMVYRATMQ
jgi:hypothetical protein